MLVFVRQIVEGPECALLLGTDGRFGGDAGVAVLAVLYAGIAGRVQGVVLENEGYSVAIGVVQTGQLTRRTLAVATLEIAELDHGNLGVCRPLPGVVGMNL